ncbi:hypothetical protein A4D02_22265 [Niastella koreensis]|jgi:hypothetical protein|uniref:Uncharacterized protein n=2 Tax=Niastella koreensis TaxID=354356 RepID=G8TFJ4_NIAKG|nr:hypothetical protein [Niastella koreensis]AEV98425.1 hypothetical protein Niako_2070 [Niastella koreensis GR20-10]OQP53125.1 hypothetical protein A4D02_22265 [Niastella koreensis]
MKRSFLAAGIGLCIFAFTMVVSNHPVRAEQYNGNYIEQDTTPKKKKDTTKRRDTMNINLSPTSTSQQ